MDRKRVENDMLDTMFSFLQMGRVKSNYPELKKACMELRQMLMQKTAGQRKDKKKDISFDNLERVKNTIIIEAMALVISGDFEDIIHCRDCARYNPDTHLCKVHGVLQRPSNHCSVGKRKE